MSDLAIPDTYCSPEDDAGYHCPERMVCRPLKLSRKERGFNGFDEFGMLWDFDFEIPFTNIQES